MSSNKEVNIMFSYDNIGGKIKKWATWIFTAEAIIAILAGIILMNEHVLIGLLVVVLGPIVAWISSWLLYGYGQLIENSDIIAEEHKRANEKYEKVVAKNSARQQKHFAEKQAKRREMAKAIIANPDMDEDVFIDIICPNCKTELSYTKGQLQMEEGVVCPICDTAISL